jgi:hypothetical protein
VLLFDEAQHLLKSDNGFAFRCIRWWLREKVNGRPKVVAVFAGTTSALTNFFHNDDKPTTTSRTSGKNYWNYDVQNVSISPKIVYPPFFHICTIGCLRNLKKDQRLHKNELEVAAYYGRPLFAYLQSENMLFTDKSKLKNILTRMTLSKYDWTTDDQALYSILGTRIQMGMTTSFHFASDMVANAYAHLVYFDANTTGGNKVGPISQIAFLPDPVCAALAMGLMCPNWNFDGYNESTTSSKPVWKGKDPKFWSQKVMHLFSKGLCFAAKGDAGEIMVALYMLFCGDSLRMKGENPMIKTFSVSLLAWFLKMKKPKDVDASDDEMEQESFGSSEDQTSTTSIDERVVTMKDPDANPNPSNTALTVSFIQICRNYFRECRLDDEKWLERMYKSGVGYYVYQGCPAIDLMCAIRSVGVEGDATYHPLLVSVKCWKEFKSDQIDLSIEKMKVLLCRVRTGEDINARSKYARTVYLESKELPKLAALCLLVVIGAGSVGIVEDYNANDLGAFPKTDEFRVVVVPHNDPFHISRSIVSTTDTQEISEIYASHSCAYGDMTDVANAADSEKLVYALEEEKRANYVLRGKKPKKGPFDFVKGLFALKV